MRHQALRCDRAFQSCAAALVLVLAAACSGDSPAAADAETPTRTPPATLAAPVPEPEATATPGPTAGLEGRPPAEPPTPAPARVTAPPPPDTGASLNQARRLGELTLTLSVLPGNAGTNEVSLFVSDPSGGDGGVESVTFRFAFLDSSARAIDVEGAFGHPGHFFVIGEHMRHAGRWRIDVAVRGKGRPEASASFEVRIR